MSASWDSSLSSSTNYCPRTPTSYLRHTALSHCLMGGTPTTYGFFVPVRIILVSVPCGAQGPASFLDWWKAHLVENCAVDLENGIFVDQKYCDLLPSYFDNVKLLKHPGYNVAYWNLLHRRVYRDRDSGEWRVNAVPLRFFHFSGVVPSDRAVFSKHQDRFGVYNIGDVRDLLNKYISALNELSHLSNVN